MRRRKLRILFAVAIVLFVGVWLLLRSGIVAHAVARSLGQSFGTRVELDGIAVGWESTSFRGLRVFDQDDGIILSAADGTADVGAWNAVAGSLDPDRVTLSSPNVLLRVGPDGRPLSRFAGGSGSGGGKIPTLGIDGGTLTVRQDGKPDLVVTAVVGEGFHATGTNADLGPIVADFADNTLHLATTTSVPTSTKAIGRLPFVDPAWLADYPIEGLASVDLKLTFGDPFRYRVAVTLDRAKGRVVPAELDVAHASGMIVVEDGVVTLRDLKADAAGGAVRVGGTVKLGESVRVELDVQGDGFDVTRLPASWGLNQYAAAGRLTGRAKLRLDLGPDGVRTDGYGKGKIVGAEILGAKSNAPVEITLVPSRGGFRLGPTVRSKQQSGMYDMARDVIRGFRGGAAPDAGRVRLKFGFDDIDVRDFLNRINVIAPIAIDGRVSVSVEVELPTEKLDDLREYRVTGTFRSAALTLEDITLDNVAAAVDFRDGVLRLSELVVGVPASRGGGSLRGAAKLGVAPAGDFTAKLELRGLSLAAFAPIVGTVTGSAEVFAPAGRLGNLTAWTGKGNLATDTITAFGWSLRKASAVFDLGDGRLSLAKCDALIEGGRLEGSGELRLGEKFPFRASLAVSGFDLAAVGRLAADVRPPIDIDGKLTINANASGDLLTPTFHLGGATDWRGVHVEGVPVDRLRFDWSASPTRVTLDKIVAEMGSGSIEGNAVLPIDKTLAGSARLTAKGVELKPLVAVAKLPLEGTVEGTLTADSPAGDVLWNAKLDLTSPRVRFQKMPIDRIEAGVAFRDGAAEYRLVGRSLGGKISASGKRSFRPLKVADEPLGSNSVRIEDVRVEALIASQGIAAEKLPLSGRVSATFDFTDEPLAGKGRVTVRGLKWGVRELSALSQADLRLRGNELRISNISASALEGSLTGQLAVNLDDLERSWMRLSLESVHLGRLIGAFAPEVAPLLDARVSMTVQTRLGWQFRGGAQLVVGSGKLFGASVSDIRVPLEWEAMPELGRFTLAARDWSGQVSSGRVGGTASFEVGPEGTHLDGQVTFNGVDIGRTVTAVDDLPFVGVGRATGTLTFGGRDVKGVADLTGRVRATFGQSDPFEIPILREIRPFLGRLTSQSTAKSELRASLARGIIKVDRLALTGPALSVYASGTVTVQGRLDLDVIAATNLSVLGGSACRLAGIDLSALAGPLPVGMILRASQFLSNRTIQLHVGGTAANPAVRFNPIRILAEEAIRFFIGVDPIPNGGAIP